MLTKKFILRLEDLCGHREVVTQIAAPGETTIRFCVIVLKGNYIIAMPIY